MRVTKVKSDTIQWKEVDWNGSGRDLRNDQAGEDDGNNWADDEAGDHQLPLPPRPKFCSFGLRRRAGVKTTKCEEPMTARSIAHSLAPPFTSLRLRPLASLRAGWQRLFPWQRRRRQREELAQSARRTAARSEPNLHEAVSHYDSYSSSVPPEATKKIK